MLVNETIVVTNYVHGKATGHGVDDGIHATTFEVNVVVQKDLFKGLSTLFHLHIHGK